MSTLEVRIPISPTPSFFNRVQLIAASVWEFYPDAKVRVTVGGENFLSGTAAPGRSGIEYVGVDRAEFESWKGTKQPYNATLMERFKPPFTTDYILMLDADVICMRKFNEIISPGISGVMAHVSPFGAAHKQLWGSFYELYLGKSLNGAETIPHSGWGVMVDDPAQRLSPPYFNTGVLMLSRDVAEKLYEPYVCATEFVQKNLDTYFVEQIALTLAMDQIGHRPTILPLQYNFPNQDAFANVHPLQIERVAFLHFLREDVINRTTDFESHEAISRLVARSDLKGVNALLRDRLEALHG